MTAPRHPRPRPSFSAAAHAAPGFRRTAIALALAALLGACASTPPPPPPAPPKAELALRAGGNDCTAGCLSIRGRRLVYRKRF